MAGAESCGEADRVWRIRGGSHIGDLKYETEAEAMKFYPELSTMVNVKPI